MPSQQIILSGLTQMAMAMETIGMTLHGILPIRLGELDNGCHKPVIQMLVRSSQELLPPTDLAVLMEMEILTPMATRIGLL